MDKSRRMLYPHTFTAKIINFPYKYYYKYNPVFRSYCLSIIILMPLFYKIQTIMCSPANVAKAEKRKQKEHEEYLEHLKHLI